MSWQVQAPCSLIGSSGNKPPTFKQQLDGLIDAALAQLAVGFQDQVLHGLVERLSFPLLLQGSEGQLCSQQAFAVGWVKACLRCLLLHLQVQQ